MTALPVQIEYEPTSLSSRPRRRVLMVAACPFPARRGTPIRIEQMAAELGRRGHEVHVATYHLGEPCRSPHFSVHRIRGGAGYSKTDPGPSWRKLLVVDPLLLSTVYDLAGRLRPDVIHAHHFEGLLTSLPAHHRYGIPLVFDAHVLLEGELEYYRLGMPGTLRRRASTILDRWVPRAADHVISVSEEIRDRLQAQHGLSPESVTVIANGVEAPFFEGRANAFPADGLKRVVFAGNLAAYQGADLLLDVFRHVRRERRDVRLVIVTESPTAEFAGQARSAGLLDSIQFIPSDLQQLPSLLSSADVLLNPRTRCPGVPQKLLNYMASGAPIVSFAGSSRYIVDGKSGLIIPNGDIEAFAGAILRVLANHDVGRQMGREAREFARNSLSWAGTGERIEGVYDRLLAKQFG